MISLIKIPVIHCTAGVYLRWYFNGFHYFNFMNGFEISMRTESMGTQVTNFFSVVSKIERPTKLKAEYSYHIVLEGITTENMEGFAGLLMAERVDQYEGGLWYEVEITRGDHLIRDENAPGYILDFEVTRKELPNTPAVFQKSIKLYIGDTLCDLDSDEVIPINKQSNDIAEMQDRQSDFTAQFKIRKTRAMRALFELSGEVGANTTFPYEKQTCRLIQDNIEMITGGILSLNKNDDQYYYVSIVSGNMNFFKSIDKLKITDLLLTLTNHTWNAATQAASNAGDLDYLYPLCEPSDDAGMATLIGDRANLYGGWIWPFVKVKAIWDEIFSNAGFYKSGDINSDSTFLSLFMPISSLNATDTKKYLYSAWWQGTHDAIHNEQIGFPGAVLINGDENFRQGYYYVTFTATYKIRMIVDWDFGFAPTLAVYRDASYQGDMIYISGSWPSRMTYEFEVSATVGHYITILTTAYKYFYYSMSIIEIKDAKIGYGATVTPALYLPDMTQTEFIKMICNMFGLIPDVTARDKKIFFWNFSDLYKNTAIARDWSNYLSEREDETEFKFGDYAQSNYLKFKESKDVIIDNGKGTMLVVDETLPAEKDVVTLPVSTCDEVIILDDVTVSRIGFNKYDAKTSVYVQNESIEPRIVFVKNTNYLAASPTYDKTFGISNGVTGVTPSGAIYDTFTPRIASSLEVSFSSLVVNYASLSRMLTKTNLRRAKFNLPVYEVAGLKHYIPIYLRQYKAYFYVNKINNYVPGKLCTIDLIKL